MNFVVPYDGSDLAQAALRRANDLGDPVGADVLAVTVIPRDPDCAREKRWLGPGESFNADDIETRIKTEARELAPGVTVQIHSVRRHINTGGIATRLRDVIEDVGADVVFLGCENVGRIAAPVSSIGSNVATRVGYDIYLVQSA
jgi:nucleotide-binding universal stress UspA family protein